VLREIRSHDSNIYAVLLTNYPLDDYKDELGEYDYQLNKSELKDTKKMNELIAKIRRACALRKENNTLSFMKEKNEELNSLLQQKRKNEWFIYEKGIGLPIILKNVKCISEMTFNLSAHIVE
jgi:hypothetical protein